METEGCKELTTKSWETGVHKERQRGERVSRVGRGWGRRSPQGKQALRLLSHSPGLAVSLGLGALAEVVKKSLPGGRVQSGT